MAVRTIPCAIDHYDDAGDFLYPIDQHPARTDTMLDHIDEHHRSHRAGWLRAAVLGANDGIVSIAGLVVGVAAAGASSSALLASGLAGTVAGAMSMAAGEYVSVQSQADTEQADLAMERRALERSPEAELRELADIYQQRGLEPALAMQVARQLTAHDALGSHARDELGITESLRARPLQAALASAGAFAVGAVIPLLAVVLLPIHLVSSVTSAVTIAGLALTGGWAAHMGGAPVWRGALRVSFWGALALVASSTIGRLFPLAGAGV